MDLPAGKFAIDDRLLDAFKAYAVADKESGLTAENIAAEAEFARMRIRLELATANYSNEAGIRALLEVDPQILKAIDAMPEARKMAETNVARK